MKVNILDLSSPLLFSALLLHQVTRDAGPVKGGTTVIAFVKDPSGYLWELIQRKDSPEPLCQVMLRVGDLKKSEEWYSKVLGMKLLRERDTPEYKYTLGFMGYGPEEISAVIELTYNYGTSSYIKGNAFSQVAVATKDIQKTAEQVKAAGGKVLAGPTTVPTIVAAGAHDQSSSSLSLVTEDPDGWRIIFVQQ
ncbi:hypothetical protein CEUSTIGMA_g2800.t1 [Chlamydomonas eustigma]|uniref:VOC domain-containing protein n=1 Tax=Chlamydomonas eustigma TaxID=1157962 RepID=A0A250WX45_9CHLO|nr:hypothetical protein CEUSTIGMA_g2800.t1 [Chlamydomonas eustigma]|eukprot:GAX75356.1 hypothetical protein CEUSTIGMA_g2800.t1 [Chlamydomonas eustigma]